MWLYWRRWTITRVYYRSVLSLLILLLPTLALGAAVPYEDTDCDGIYTPGVDVDLSAEIGLPGYPPRNLAVFVENCLVLPAGSVSPKPWASIFLHARTVTLHTPLTAAPADPFSYAFIKGEEGLIATAGVTVGGEMYIGTEAGGTMVIGDGTRWTSRSSYVDFVSNKHLLVGRNVVVRATSYARFIAEGPVGVVTTEPGLNMLVSDTFGQIQFDAPDGVDIDTATLKANGIDITTPAQPIAFTNSRVRTAFPNEGGYVAIWSRRFTPTGPMLGLVNVTGTQFLDVAPSILGSPIIGH